MRRRNLAPSLSPAETLFPVRKAFLNVRLTIEGNQNPSGKFAPRPGSKRLPDRRSSRPQRFKPDSIEKCRSIGNSNRPIACRRKPKTPVSLTFSIEFQPPFLFQRLWIALEVLRAIPEMVDGGLTIGPFELQRLVGGQSDERGLLTGIFDVSPRKFLRSLSMRNVPYQQPHKKLSRYAPVAR